MDATHSGKMDQTSLGIAATLQEVYLPALSATDLLSQSSDAHITASVDLPALAFADCASRKSPHSQRITFARTNLSSEQLDLLPNIPPDGTIAVVVDVDGTSGYVDEEQPPRLMLTVNGYGAAVYPVDNVWPWLQAVWYPTAESFDNGLAADGSVSAEKDTGSGRGTDLR